MRKTPIYTLDDPEIVYLFDRADELAREYGVPIKPIKRPPVDSPKKPTDEYVPQTDLTRSMAKVRKETEYYKSQVQDRIRKENENYKRQLYDDFSRTRVSSPMSLASAQEREISQNISAAQKREYRNNIDKLNLEQMRACSDSWESNSPQLFKHTFTIDERTIVVDDADMRTREPYTSCTGPR